MRCLASQLHYNHDGLGHDLYIFRRVQPRPAPAGDGWAARMMLGAHKQPMTTEP